jgi:hypothetical protein
MNPIVFGAAWLYGNVLPRGWSGRSSSRAQIDGLESANSMERCEYEFVGGWRRIAGKDSNDRGATDFRSVLLDPRAATSLLCVGVWEWLARGAGR